MYIGRFERFVKSVTEYLIESGGAGSTFEVGDVAGHSYPLGQGTCSASASMSGEKTGAYTEFDELWKESFAGHGRFNVTMDNGDMVYSDRYCKAPATSGSW